MMNSSSPIYLIKCDRNFYFESINKNYMEAIYIPFIHVRDGNPENHGIPRAALFFIEQKNVQIFLS